MTEATATKGKIRKPRQAIGEGPRTRFALIAMALVFLALMLIAPLLVVFVEAFSRGLGVYIDALAMPDTSRANTSGPTVMRNAFSHSPPTASTAGAASRTPMAPLPPCQSIL